MTTATTRILCVPGVFDSALHIVHDSLRTAMTVVEEVDPTRSFRVELLTINGEAIRTGSGQTLQPDAALPAETSELIFVPGFLAGNDVRQVVRFIESPIAAEAMKWLQVQHRAGARIATACTGAWLVAEAGLLDGLLATTTWYFQAAFRDRYPRVRLDPSKMLTVDQGILCAGAAMAHMDLVLSSITALCGAEVSRRVAALLLIDARASQSQYMIPDFFTGDSEDLRRIDAWIRAHLAEPISVASLARGTHLSARSLARRIKDGTGETPIGMVQRIRIQQAVHQLKTTSMSVSAIAKEVGYRDAATLRRLIRKQTGLNPRQLRTSAPE